MRYLSLCALLILTMAVSVTATAETPVYKPPGHAGKQEIVARAESYLRNLDTLRARFIQVGNDGSRLEGAFYLDRPGRLRFEYDALEDFIVADGTFIYFYDAQLGEQSNAPIGQTLADFLLREDLRLSGDVQVKGVQEAENIAHITLVQSGDPAAGSLRLSFHKEPFQLHMWRVVDGQGFITEVYLKDIERGVSLARSLFVYRDPDRGVRRLNP